MRVLLFLTLALALAAPAQKPEAFDVATVKLNKTGARGGYPGLAPGNQTYAATNLPLLALIMLAYDVTPRQISGVPPSFNTEGYDVEAKCDHPITKQQAARMLQTLLAERFSLTLHHETREESVYALVIAKSGSKLRETKDLSTTNVHKTPRGVEYKSTPLSTLTLVLSQQLGRTVVDKTGLTGRYDFTLEYAPDNAQARAGSTEPTPDPDNLPSVFTALQEQLGLRLESQKGPVDFIVVDHAEKPQDK